MTSFHSLSSMAQIRLLRRMAYLALDHYDVDVGALRCVSNRYSTIFRVETEDGRRYALRINAPGQRTPQMIFSEMSWVEALARDTDVCVAAPLRTLDGRLLVTIEMADIPEARHIVMTHWLDGQLLTQYPNAQSFHLLGAAMAKLHQHAATYQPPPGFMMEKLNTPWQWGEPHYLHPHDYRLTGAQKALLRRAVRQCEAWLAEIYTDERGIRFIHADLHLKNAVLQDGVLQIFDFDDSIWGHPLQDLAVPLYWIASQADDSMGLRRALLAGYAQQARLPYDAQHLHNAVLFRTIQAINFLIHYRLSSKPQAVNNAFGFLANWLVD